MSNVSKSKESLAPLEEVMRRNLEKFREESGLSQAQIAEMSGVPTANYARYERGDNAIPAHVLKPIADALGRSTDDFYLTSPPPPRTEPPVFFLRTRPGIEIDQAVYERLLAELDRANREIRPKKK